MKSKNVTSRVSPEVEDQLNEINVKPARAIQVASDILVWLRRATIPELHGLFTRDEIKALADSFNGVDPNWQIMSKPEVLVAIIQDGERYRKSFSRQKVDVEKILETVKTLTAAQAMILQLELCIFWTRDKSATPNFETLYNTLY